MSFPIISPPNECILQMLIVGEFWMFLHTITPISFVQQTPAERCFSWFKKLYGYLRLLTFDGTLKYAETAARLVVKNQRVYQSI